MRYRNKEIRPQQGFPPAAVFLMFLVGIVSAFTAGMLLGRGQGVQSVVPEGEGRVINRGGAVKDLDFSTFWNVWNFVKENYYQQPVSDQDLFYGSLKGILAGLDDPYSTFFNPEEAEEFNESLNGSFEGIGAQIDADETGQILIVAPLPDSPAEVAGLLAGDRILAIDKEDTFGMSVEEAVSKIRGPEGTAVTLTVTRNGLDSAFDVSITRQVIKIDSLKLEMRDDGLAIVSVYFFNEDTSALFTSAVNDLLKQGAKGIVLDLRGNPGGLLDTAIDLASAWVGQRTVVYQSVRGVKQAFVGSSDARLSDIQTVVLVNSGSASASEIVAGALQDYSLATVVGTVTFGKGSVQDYRELEDGSAVKLTTAEWLTPKERIINHLGIVPDVVVEYTLEDLEASADPQMEKAVRLLLEPL